MLPHTHAPVPASRLAPLGRITILCGLLVGACADDPSVDDGAVARDSAGIRIVENAGSPGARWSATEVVRVGEMDGPESTTFHRIADVEVVAGRVYVLDAGDATVKVYDRAGAYISSFGGQGGGPAEFRTPTELIRRGDTLSIYDRRLVKFAHFDTAGALLGTERARFREDGVFAGAGIEPVPGGLVAWTVSGGCLMPPPEDRTPYWVLLSAEPDGRPLDTLALSVDRATIERYLPDYTGCFVIPRLGGRAFHVAVAQVGRVAYGDGEEYRIEVFDVRAGSGGPRAIFARRDDPPSITPEERSRYRDEFLNPGDPRPASFQRAIEAAWDATPEFDTWPHYTALVWDVEGRLWVRRTPRETDPMATWDVFAPGGELVASTALSAPVRVEVIESDTIWGVELDELGVQRVVAYALDRGAR